MIAGPAPELAELLDRFAAGALQPERTQQYGAERGHVNAWKCDACGAILAAVHTGAGATPMFLACRDGRRGCLGTMRSSGYPGPVIPIGILAMIRWEWARPSRTQAKRLRQSNRALFDHVERGGLLLERLTEEGRRALGELEPAPAPTTEQEQR